MKENIELAEIQTTDILGVELLYEGSFKPITGGTFEVNAKDIDDIKSNTDIYMSETGLNPVLVLDHGNQEGTALLTHVLKSMSLGKLKNFVVKTTEKLGKQVKTLVADITGVPVKLAELISKGFADRRSGEFYRSTILSKKNSGLFLKSLAIFGAAMPAVKKLNSMAEGMLAMQEPDADQLLTDDNTVMLLVDGEFQTENKEELHSMDELKAVQKENETLKERLKELEQKVELTEKVSAIESDTAVKMAELQTQLADTEKNLKEVSEKHNAIILLQNKDREAKIKEFVVGLSDKKILKPAKQDEVIALFKRFGDNDDMIALQMDLLSAKGEDEKFTEKLPKATAKSSAVDGGDDMATMESRVVAYCEEQTAAGNQMNALDAKDFSVAIKDIYKV